jgi:hypothetical protein
MPIWQKTNGRILNQGDLLRGIAVPKVLDEFPQTDADGRTQIDVADQDVIILSQSCDLEQRKVSFVVVALAFSLADFEEVNGKGWCKKWPEVGRGRHEGLHLLFGPEAEDKARECLVIDFRVTASLPLPYVENFAERSGDRWRLQSPYLENMSQAFARFFMRVALPKDLPRDGYETGGGTELLERP